MHSMKCENDMFASTWSFSSVTLSAFAAPFSLVYLATFASSSWFILVYSPLHFDVECMSFLSSLLTLLILFFYSNWTKEVEKFHPVSLAVA